MQNIKEGGSLFGDFESISSKEEQLERISKILAIKRPKIIEIIERKIAKKDDNFSVDAKDITEELQLDSEDKDFAKMLSSLLNRDFSSTKEVLRNEVINRDLPKSGKEISANEQKNFYPLISMEQIQTFGVDGAVKRRVSERLADILIDEVLDYYGL